MESITPIMDLAGKLTTTAGVLALVLWLWWQERSERRELAAQVLKLTVDQIEAEREMTTALTALAAKVKT